MAKKQPTVNPRRVLPPTPPTTINRITGTGRPGMTTNPIKSTLLEVEPTPKGVYTEKGRGRKQCVGCGAYITSSYHTCPVCNAPQPYNPRGERKEQPISANVFAIVRATVTFLQSQGNDADKALTTLNTTHKFVEAVGGWSNAVQAIESFAAQESEGEEKEG